MNIFTVCCVFFSVSIFFWFAACCSFYLACNNFLLLSFHVHSNGFFSFIYVYVYVELFRYLQCYNTVAEPGLLYMRFCYVRWINIPVWSSLLSFLFFTAFLPSILHLHSPFSDLVFKGNEKNNPRWINLLCIMIFFFGILGCFLKMPSFICCLYCCKIRKECRAKWWEINKRIIIGPYATATLGAFYLLSFKGVEGGNGY